MKPRTFPGFCNRGQFVPDDRAGYYTALSDLAGQRIAVTVGTERKARSQPQNRYLWGVIYAMIAEHTGHDTDDIHAACATRHLLTNPGDPIPVVKSTADLSTVEFSEYCEAIQRDAATGYFGGSLYIPDPNEAPERVE
jgi:hypothetical protein